MKTRAIIIQARNGAARFPNKMISTIDSKGTLVFDFLLKRLKGIVNESEIYLATTNLERDNSLCKIAKNNNINCFRGDENNVLDRFVRCADEYKIDEIIRVCADNPFINLEDLEVLYTTTLENKDYISFNIKGSPSIKTHYGFWAELVSLDALKKVQKLTNERLYIEHVTNFIYENPTIFNVDFIDTQVEDEILDQNIRLTLDTIEDLDIIRYIVNQLDMMPKDIKVKNVYNTIKDKKDIKNKMFEQIEKNSK